MYQEYAKYPLITKKRMFYETMEDILPGLKVIINGSDGTQTMLPLDSFVSGTQSSTGSPAGSYNSQANQPDQTGRANQAGADSGSPAPMTRRNCMRAMTRTEVDSNEDID